MPEPGAIMYSPHPALAMEQAFLERLREKTGRSIGEWKKAVRAFGGVEKEAVAWLKGEHGLGTNHAKTIAKHAFGRGDEYDDPLALVDAMYSGPKNGLRGLNDALVKLALGLGPEVKACPGKTLVSLYRNHVFAQVKPSTRTRVDLGLALRDRPAEGRLIDTGGFAKGDRISHRIPISSPEEIDRDARGWLERAYRLDA